MNKQLPSNIEAEQALLGKILMNDDALMLVADTLQPVDFYRDAHRTIYEAMIGLMEHALPVNYINVCDALERAGKLEDVGGGSYLSSIIDTPDATFADAEWYGRVLVQKSMARQLVFAAGNIAALGYSEDEEMLPKAEAAIFDIARRTTTHEAVTIEELSYDYLEEIHDLRQRPKGTIVGVPTGFRQLDFLTGGLQCSDLVVLAARPGMGKTSLALAVALNAAKKQKRVLIFSLEMSKRQLVQRLTSMIASVDLQRLRIGRLDDEEWYRVEMAVASLAEMKDRLVVDDTQGLTPLEARARSLVQQKSGGLDLIVLDYLQRMEARINGKRIENRIQEVSDISNKLKSLALELNIPVLALAQLSRETEKRNNKRPQLSDLNESGKIEQDADIIAFIYREDYYAEQDKRDNYTPDNLANLIIAKHRNGPTDEIALHFEGAFTRFTDIRG